MDRFYVTTPIYYATDKPHIGHAYTTIAADVLARYWRRKIGHDRVFFLTGTDEHGAKVARAAGEAGIEPALFVAQQAVVYQDVWHQLGISHDFFIQTSDAKHIKFAQDFLQKLYANGAITKGLYEGLYCVGCERFVVESELVNGRCPDHPSQELVHHKEENYFFALSRWAKEIADKIRADDIYIFPKERRNEILTRLAEPVHDISISRQSVQWGVPIPWDKSQTVYVWVEALLNYASALEIAGKNEFWPPTLQLMGKEILWFHAVIWPALLLAAGKELPKTIIAHGWFTVSGQKMSKSLGNVIDPVELAKRYGADATRYFLLTGASFGADGDVSVDRFAAQYQADLSNQLGNILQRTLVLRQKFGVHVSAGAAPSCAEADRLTEAFQFEAALFEIWKLIRAANEKLDQDAPWNEKDEGKRAQTLTSITRQLETIGQALEPYLPETAAKLRAQLAGGTIEPLFPRLHDS